MGKGRRQLGAQRTELALQEAGPSQRPLYAVTDLILTTTVRSYLTDEEAEVQRSEVTGLRSQRDLRAGHPPIVQRENSKHLGRGREEMRREGGQKETGGRPRPPHLDRDSA